MFTKHALGLILALNLVLLGVSLCLGMKSAGQMREIVKEDFNQQQLALARQTASLLEQDFDFLKRELQTLNHSPSIQYVEPLTWANRMRATLASVRQEGVVEIRRVNADGTRMHMVDERGLDLTSQRFGRAHLNSKRVIKPRIDHAEGLPGVPGEVGLH